MLNQHAFYLSHAFGEEETIIEQAREALAGISYDSLVGTGLSGSLVVPVIARALDKHWMIVRKDSEGSHSYRKAEGSLGAKWVFVDDLIDAGGTIRRVQERIKGICESHDHITKHVGTYLYAPINGEQLWTPVRSYRAAWKPAKKVDSGN